MTHVRRACAGLVLALALAPAVASANPTRRGFNAIRAVACVVESVSSSSDSCMETSTGSQSCFAMASESYLGGPPAGNIPTLKRSGARAATSTVVEPAPTRDHTERMLEGFGVELVRDGAAVTVRGGQTLRATPFTPERVRNAMARS